jgi:hypothetical protein
VPAGMTKIVRIRNVDPSGVSPFDDTWKPPDCTRGKVDPGTVEFDPITPGTTISIDPGAARILMK